MADQSLNQQKDNTSEEDRNRQAASESGSGKPGREPQDDTPQGESDDATGTANDMPAGAL